MSDVFNLPLRLDEEWYGIYSGKKQAFKPNFNFDEWEREANAVIQAVNSYDKLVDEIKQLVQRNAELEKALKENTSGTE